jgi:predicted amidohydrolase YtcJ
VSHNFDLVLRHAQLPGGNTADVGVVDGRYSEIAPQLGRSDNDIDCRGERLLPGLHDHHIHLLATAARLQSVDVSDCTDPEAILSALRAQAAQTAPGDWVRAIGFDERTGGIPDRYQLDVWLPSHPLRMQDRTGALWVLNSIGLGLLGGGGLWPEAVEMDAGGKPTGRIWRGDDWLRTRIGGQPPSLRPLSQQMARYGVTTVTDAGASNGPDEAAILASAKRSGDLCQRLILMGREDLPASDGYQLGPVKLLFDERSLPGLDAIAARITMARSIGRAVAAHCVTEAELLIYLAALEAAGGARPGDRIEHGSLIPHSLIADIAEAQIIVVANPGFIARRGDRYRAEIDPLDLPNLHRLASLARAGISLLAGSDAPYGLANPWVAIRAAMHRKTSSGAVLGPDEALSDVQALALFSANCPIQIGNRAGCMLIDRDWTQLMSDVENPNPVRVALIDGQLA